MPSPTHSHTPTDATNFLPISGNQNAVVLATKDFTTTAPALMVLGGLSVEAQVLIALLGRDCKSGAWDWSRVGAARHLVSPFSAHGPAWGAVWDAVLGACLFALLGLVCACAHFAMGGSLAESLGRVWFPGAGLVCLRMLVVGVGAHTMDVLTNGDIRNSSEGSVAAFVGILYCVCVVCGHALCGGFTGGLTYLERPSTEPSQLKRALLEERGVWEPVIESGRIAGVVRPFRGGWRRYVGVVPPVVCVWACVVIGAGGCTTAPLLMGIAAACACIGYGATRALRSDAQTALTCVCYVALAGSCSVEIAASQIHIADSDLTVLRTVMTGAVLCVTALRMAHEVLLWVWAVFFCSSSGKVPADVEESADLDGHPPASHTNDYEDLDAVDDAVESCGSSAGAVEMDCDDGVVVLDEGSHIVMSMYDSQSHSLAASQTDVCSVDRSPSLGRN